MGESIPDALRPKSGNQSGVVSRRQAIDCTMSPGAIRSNLKCGRWQMIYPGVYATFSGPLGRRAKLWAAVLHGGKNAQLSHETAAEVDGLTDQQSALIHLTIPHEYRIRPVPGVRVHRSRHLRDLRFPGGELPRTWVEDTVLDLADGMSDPDGVCALVTSAFGRRKTSAGRMRAVLADRPVHHWRDEISELITLADGGAHSILEVRYDRDVERAHGLPLSRHQVPFRKKDGSKGFRDRVYEDFGVIIELDGRLAHPNDKQWEDKERDNAAAEDDQQSLRYGWRHVRVIPCETAVQVAAVLRGRGWEGRPGPCSKTCPVAMT